MDLNLPSCVYRKVGTIMVIVKMDVTCFCSRQFCKAQPPSGCELCKRTSLISKYNSDCVSDVNKCRPYRSSVARRRYVNVCAAVCLLLLVGGLSPQSSAAPHRTRVMERQRRATGENQLWGNPCDYNESNSNSGSPKHTRDIAPKLVAQAKSAHSSAAKYKDKIAALHSFTEFDKLLEDWENHEYEWLRKLPWYREEILPKEKQLYSTMPDAYMNELMTKIDDVLPVMYKSLKMIVAGFYAFSRDGLNANIDSDEKLKVNINQMMHDVRAVLCYFSDLMKARHLDITPLLDSEIPDFTHDDKLSKGLFLYRDTLNYLEYLEQVFQKLSDIQSE